jgi:hypothetical protein
MRTKTAVKDGFNKMATDLWALGATIFEGCTDEKGIDKGGIMSVA